MKDQALYTVRILKFCLFDFEDVKDFVRKIFHKEYQEYYHQSCRSNLNQRHDHRLNKKQEVVDLLYHEISALNKELASYETIKKFRILEEELDQDKDEITPTLKVKRDVVFAHYQYLIDEMYAGN